MSVYPNTGCHAVLALLSEGYPPLEGRSPTRYSPVCHSTHPLRDFRVRLACVRHAASVDSEPGSNSQVKFAVPPLPASSAGRNLFNPSSLLNWLSDSIPTFAPRLRSEELRRAVQVMVGHTLATGARRPLILDGLCLHVLSSFQRTGSPLPGRLPSAPRSAVQGEPFNCTTGLRRCQPFLPWHVLSVEPAAQPITRARPAFAASALAPGHVTADALVPADGRRTCSGLEVASATDGRLPRPGRLLSAADAGRLHRNGI